MNPAVVSVLIFCIPAAWCDLRSRRIPNVIPALLLACGVVEALLRGWQTAAMLAGIVAVALLAGTLAFSLRLIGGGDVKLLAAAAGTLGFPTCVPFLLFTMLSGGILALAIAAMRGRLAVTLGNVQALTLPLLAGVRPARIERGIAMPYALAIFAGAACTASVNAFAPHLRLIP